MQRGVAAYIIMLVILIIVVLIFSYYPKSSNVTNTTTTAEITILNSTTTTTVSPIQNSSTTTVPAGTCLSGLPRVNIPNGDFATGTYSGWNVSGAGFSAVPLNLTFANLNGYHYGNVPWSGSNTVYAATTYRGGISVQPGNITSSTFFVNEPYLNFKIISPQDSRLAVEILRQGKPAITVHYNTYALKSNPNPQTTFVNASIVLASLLCQNVTIKVLATVVGTSTTEYIAATDFYMSSKPLSTPGIVVNQTFAK